MPVSYKTLTNPLRPVRLKQSLQRLRICRSPFVCLGVRQDDLPIDACGHHVSYFQGDYVLVGKTIFPPTPWETDIPQPSKKHRKPVLRP